MAFSIVCAGALAGCGGSSPPINSGYQVSAEDIDDYIAEASDRFNLPEPWIREIMRVESGGQQYLNGRPITSSAGAMGLMQVMPATYEELRRRHDLGSDPYDPRNNILAGTAYLREMYDLFGSPGFLAAYNAGVLTAEHETADWFETLLAETAKAQGKGVPTQGLRLFVVEDNVGTQTRTHAHMHATQRTHAHTRM